MRCDRCDRPAVIDLPYRSAHLCGTHLRASVLERARRELHRQLPRFRGGTIAVALSGGKDSAVALALTHRYFARRRDVRLIALTVDEGIAGYRPKTIESARALSASLGIEHLLLSSSDRLGVTTDETARSLPGATPCAFCGVWRRTLLNQGAREAGAEFLVLGFNLDDLAQTVLMNLARADLDRLARMAPHRSRQPGLIPRLAPLAQIPEREVYLYARLAGLPFDHGECPHAGPAMRNVFREVVWKLEESLPGTRQSLLRTQAQLAPLFDPARTGAAGATPCPQCGEPSSGGLCRSCAFRARAGQSYIPPAASGTA